MPRPSIVLKNGTQSVTFAPVGRGGYRPEWFRLGRRPMLRFKDHEFLNVGAIRVTEGQLLDRSSAELIFGGEVELAKVTVAWSVRVALPEDGGGGFVVTTGLMPLQEPIELLEAMSTFELPYEYDGTEHQMTVMSQQPVYRFEGDEEITGAGWVHPNWYYGKPGRAHLTFPSTTPLMLCRVADADGSNPRCTVLLGNWDVCSVQDMFAQPTRALRPGKADTPFADARLKVAPGLRGRKFLVGALNWNTSLHKDPNVLVEPGEGLSQELTVDFAGDLPAGRWDRLLADAWQRVVKVHFPADGHVPAWQVATSRGASWIEAAEWLTDQFAKPEGCPGFFYPDRGTCVYAPHTRPSWDDGVQAFCGQWVGPVAFLGHAWKDPAMIASTERLERLFAADTAHPPEQISTIGPTPQYAAVMRKARLMGVDEATLRKVRDWVCRRTDAVLDPPPGARRGDGGILAWDAFANLLAADLFDRENRLAAAEQLLDRVRCKLDERFEAFNCAAEGDFVGAGQGRPFGHGVALAANVLAWRQWGRRSYLDTAERCGNIVMGLYYAAYNSSATEDLDWRGWAVGATGGRDQMCRMPPWETAYALQQLAYLIEAGRAREGFYDLLWLFAHTGLCMFPKARTTKRLYTPDLAVTFRSIDAVATEREFYLKLPYLAYEEPWDQTMLAGYQGVEPLILSLYLGGGLVAAEDDRVLALVPQAATYDQAIARKFIVHLWNPLARPIRTRLGATVAVKRGERWRYAGPADGGVSESNPLTEPLSVPSRKVTKVTFRKA